MDWIWSIVAGLSLIVAAIFLLRDDIDATFVAATIGAVAWFIGLRQRLRKKNAPVAEDFEHNENQHTPGDEDED